MTASRFSGPPLALRIGGRPAAGVVHIRTRFPPGPPLSLGSKAPGIFVPISPVFGG